MKLLTFALSYHGEIDIASIELHVDLLVDQCLALLMVVLSDLRTHLVNVVVVVVVVVFC